ncbi:MAG: hypothetical protein Q4D81_04295 [Eubacteriales bacterium]|nr:hypothetical protein [Eubacteriales bacterium]
MKCKNCGGEISLEELYCPYCGSPNTEARQHARDMQKYRTAFQQTKEDVTLRAGRQSRRTVQIAAITFLLLAIAANIFIQVNSFALSGIWRKSRAAKNTEEYLEQAEQYLDDEDYIAFSAYFSRMQLSSNTDNFDKYYPVYRIAQNYRYAALQLMSLLSPGRYSNLEHTKKYTAEYIQDFYESLKPENYSFYDSFNSEWSQQHITKMRESMESLLIAYLGMTAEEARSMPELSAGNRTLLVERGLEQYGTGSTKDTEQTGSPEDAAGAAKTETTGSPEDASGAVETEQTGSPEDASGAVETETTESPENTDNPEQEGQDG